MERIGILLIVAFLILHGCVLGVMGLSQNTIYEPELLPPETFTSLNELMKKYPDLTAHLIQEYSHSFLTPQKLKFLGEFKSLTLLWDTSSGTQHLYSYAYQLVDEAGLVISIEVVVIPYWFNIYSSYLQETDKKRFAEIENDYQSQTIKHEGILYCYGASDASNAEKRNLETVIVLNGVGTKYVITTDWKNVSELKSDLLSQLLYAETATEAADEIMARLNGTYVAPWVYPTAICGGAVVLAAAVAIPTVILRRKKRKAAAAAAADAPTPDEGEDTPA